MTQFGCHSWVGIHVVWTSAVGVGQTRLHNDAHGLTYGFKHSAFVIFLVFYIRKTNHCWPRQYAEAFSCTIPNPGNFIHLVAIESGPAGNCGELKLLLGRSMHYWVEGRMRRWDHANQTEAAGWNKVCATNRIFHIWDSKSQRFKMFQSRVPCAEQLMSGRSWFVSRDATTEKCWEKPSKPENIK